MAVTRERRQFKIGRIGVARASQAGVIEAEGIQKAAANLEQRFFNQAVDAAKKRGVDAANALDRAEVVALDETGRPKAYNLPKGIGKYAREAYQAVLLQRFETEINTELRGKSSELAVKFRRSPEAYRETFSKYVADVAKTEKSTVFTNYINTLGTGLLNDQYRGLQLQAVARQEANDKIAYQNSAANLLNDIENTAAVGKDTSELVNQGTSLDRQYINSGIVLSNETLDNLKFREIANARGVFRYELNQALKRGIDITTLQNAIVGMDLQDISDLSTEYFPKVSEILGSKDISFIESISDFATELLTDGATKVTIQNQELARLRNQESISILEELNNSFVDLLSGPSSEVEAKLEDLISKYIHSQETANLYSGTGVSEDFIKSLTMSEDGQAEILSNIAIKKMLVATDSYDDLRNVQNYFNDPKPENLEKIISDESRSLAISLTNFVEQTGLKSIFEDIDKQAESLSDDKRDAQNKAKYEATVKLNSSVKNDIFPVISSATSEEEIENILSRSSGVISSSGVDKDEKQNQSNQVKNKAGGAYLRLAFKSTVNENQIDALKAFAREGKDTTGLLTDKQKELVNKGKDLIGADDESYLSTQIQNYTAAAKNRLSVNAAIQERTNLLNNAMTGSVDGNDEELRTELSTIMQVEPSYFFNTDSVDVNKDLTLQKMSESIFTSAQVEAINMFLNGQVTDPDQIDRFLTTTSKSLEFVTAAGDVIRSRGSYAIEPENFALLREAISFAETVSNDPQAILQHVTRLKNALATDELQTNMDMFFTRASKGTTPSSNNVTSYIINNYPEARGNSNLRERLITLAKITYFSNDKTIADTGRFTDIDSVLKDEIKKNYVEDDMISAEDGTNRTLFPLSVTAKGFEQPFVDYIRKSMKNMSTNKDVDWDTVEFKLHPVGYNSKDNGMTYGVVIVDEMGTRQLQEVAISLTEVDEAQPLPAFFSTNEPLFRGVKAGIIKANDAARMELAKRLHEMEKAMADKDRGVRVSTESGIEIPLPIEVPNIAIPALPSNER